MINLLNPSYDKCGVINSVIVRMNHILRARTQLANLMIAKDCRKKEEEKKEEEKKGRRETVRVRASE